MSQIMKKWIGDNQIDHTKLDPSDAYTVRALNVTSDATVAGKARVGSNLFVGGNVLIIGDMTVAGTTTVTNTEVTISEELQINQSLPNPGILINQAGNAAALRIHNTGGNDAIVIDNGNIVLGTGTLVSSGDSSVLGNLYVGNDASVANSLTVGSRYSQPLLNGDVLFGTHGGTGLLFTGDNGTLNRVIAQHDYDNNFVGHLILEGDGGSTSISLDDATVSVSASDLEMFTSVATLYGTLYVGLDTTVFNSMYVNNFLAIGTPDPTEYLHVAATSSVDGVGIALENTYGGSPAKYSITAGPGNYLHFIDELNSLERMTIDGYFNTVNVIDSLTLPSSDFASNFSIISGPVFSALHIYDNYAFAERLTISDIGYVGVGVFPNYNFDVNGDIHASGYLIVDNFASLNNGLGVTGNASVDSLSINFGGMGCSGDAYFFNDASIYYGNLYVNTDASVAGSLTVGNRVSESLSEGDVIFGTHGGTGLRFSGDNGTLNRVTAMHDYDNNLVGRLILEGDGGNTSITLDDSTVNINGALSIFGNLFYEQGIFVGSLFSTYINNDATFTYQRLGNQVTIAWPTITIPGGTRGSGYLFYTDRVDNQFMMPDSIRPLVGTYVGGFDTVNTTYGEAVSVANIHIAGVGGPPNFQMEFYWGYHNSFFDPGQNNTILAGSLTYLISTY